MNRLLTRVAASALIGALVGAIAATFAFAMHPAMTLDLDRDLPAVTTGFYPVERANDESFAWTSSRGELSLPRFDRGTRWSCRLDFRGAHPPGLPTPTLQVTSDGDIVARGLGTNQYQVLTFDLPAAPQGGLRLTLVTTPTFVPSSSDRRDLGVQVRSLTCIPEARVARPPMAIIASAAISMAIVAAMLAALGLTDLAAACGIAGVAAALAFALSSGMAPYSRYPIAVPWIAAWIAVISLGAVAIVRQLRRPLDAGARLALAVTVTFLFVEMIGLLHPSKGIADALFHAHRLEWVLNGRFYFTQQMPSGVNFPYAIALYVVAAPWSHVTRDFMALLKVVVLVARALAALILYPLLARVWNDRAAGILAIVACHLVPLPFSVLFFANLTYAFGQSVTAATLAWMAMYPTGGPARPWLVVLILLATLAFLSHVGLFPLLLAMMVATAISYWALGGSKLRPAAYQIVLAAVLAAVVSVVVYYGHFPESYRTLQKLRPGAATAVSTAAPPASTLQVTNEATKRTLPVRTPMERLGRTAVIAELSFGWAVLALAILGAAALWARRTRDPVALLAAACVVVYAVFVTGSALAPIEPSFQRYAEEFISRVNFAAVPIVALLAARGATWAWSRHIAWRVAVVTLLAVMVVTGADGWLSWLR